MKAPCLPLLAGAALLAAADSALLLLDTPARQTPLPARLTEVSGLTFQGPDTLWAHDDERGAAVALEPGTGRVLAHRVLGPAPVRGDFEGITWDGDALHLVTSSGTLVSFRPGSAEAVERYGVRETAAGSWCEVEGVALDPRRRTLVLACKEIFRDRGQTGLLLLETDLPPSAVSSPEGPPQPVRVHLSVTSERLRDHGLPRRLELSDITYDAARDSWLLVSARRGRVVEVSRDGQVLGQARLPSGRHPQPEGLALSPDRQRLHLADEGGNARARLTWYGSPVPDAER